MGIIACKSFVLSQLLKENMNIQIAGKNLEHKKVIIDFKGQIQYQAFKKIIDFCYLDDLGLLKSINDSSEMIEVIKLANRYGLVKMVKATEGFFQEHMINLLESNSTSLSLKI